MSLTGSTTEYCLVRPLVLEVAGTTISLEEGQGVRVLGVNNGKAVVQITLNDGGTVVGEMVTSDLKAVSPPVAAVEVLEASPPASPTPEPPAGEPVLEDSFPRPHSFLKPGWNKLQLEGLPEPAGKPKWFRYDFDPTQERFNIYVPTTYDARDPCGILAWTNAGDGDGIPPQFVPLFEEFRLIAVAAERCGNKQASDRRAGLLVSAILELSQSMAIDRERVILSGFSGGGRLSALAGFVHPEIISGVISWCGGNFYRDYPDSSKPGYVKYGIARAHKIDDAVTKKNVGDARRKVKFVLITGAEDFNRTDSQDITNAMESEGFQVLLIEEPVLGHRVGSAETMREALEFVLGAVR